jgi:catechol 2,3-dioxygenase-like lactoylglutathione lyase family enzyme
VFRLTSLDHIVLRVGDIERCLEFYKSALGCSVEQTHTELGLHQLRAGDFIIDLLDVDGPIGREGGSPPGPTGHDVDHFCVRIEPFDEQELRQHLARHRLDEGLAVTLGDEIRAAAGVTACAIVPDEL